MSFPRRTNLASEGFLGQPTSTLLLRPQRLFAVLQAVHLRGEMHITVREVHALLWSIFSSASTSGEDYHAGSESSTRPGPCLLRRFA